MHPVFAIQTVRITGAATHLNAAVVRTTVIRPMRGTFFTANLSEVKRLAEAMPWVRRAQVSRSWPNTIVIDIEEHVAFARLNADQLVNSFGEAFSVAVTDTDQLKTLPIFVGAAATAQLMRTRYDELNAWLAPIGSPVRRLTLSDRLSWTAVLANGVAIEFGRDVTQTTVRERAQRLASTWVSALQSVGSPSRVDLRYAGGFAVQAPGVRIGAPERKAGT
ncbi:MAG: cell division protein FtsQ/DivIB [Burkholderiaceae bacterium]